MTRPIQVLTNALQLDLAPHVSELVALGWDARMVLNENEGVITGSIVVTLPKVLIPVDAVRGKGTE